MEELLKDIQAEFPDFKVVKKSDSGFMKTLNVLLMILTFGIVRTFMVGFTTTIGNTVYTPSGWDEWVDVQKLVILRHERVHMRQSKKYGRFLFSFLYLMFPVPILFAYYRTKFEREAYAESMRAHTDYWGIADTKSDVYRSYMQGNFTSAQYAWMWILKSDFDTWFDGVIAEIEFERGPEGIK